MLSFFYYSETRTVFLYMCAFLWIEERLVCYDKIGKGGMNHNKFLKFCTNLFGP